MDFMRKDSTLLHFGRISFVLLLLAGCKAQSLYPAGQGAPSAAECGPSTLGATYTDALNNAFYACGNNGWFTPGSTPVLPTSIHNAVYQNLAVVNEAITTPLGWTSTAGNLLVVYSASTSGSTLSSITAGGVPMLPLVTFTTGRTPNNVWFLPNAPSSTSISTSWSSSNGASAALIVAEFSGVSKTAKAVGLPLTQDSGYTNSAMPPALSYAAPVGALVLSGTSFSGPVSTWAATPGWTMIASSNTSMVGTNAMMDYTVAGQAVPSLPTTISAPTAPGYGYYDTWVVGIA